MNCEAAPILGREALLGLVSWLERRGSDATSNSGTGMGTTSLASQTQRDLSLEPDSLLPIESGSPARGGQS